MRRKVEWCNSYVSSLSPLIIFGFRYYHPQWGRFLNRDPIEEAGGENLYRFVSNDPVNRWDLLGLSDNNEQDTDGTVNTDASQRDAEPQASSAEERPLHVVGPTQNPARNTVVTDGNGGLRTHLGDVEEGTPQIEIDGIELHESIHIGQILAATPKIGEGYEDGFEILSDSSVVPQMEIEAISAEINFLRENINAEKYTEPYKDHLDAYQRHIKNRIIRLEEYRATFED